MTKYLVFFIVLFAVLGNELGVKTQYRFSRTPQSDDVETQVPVALSNDEIQNRRDRLNNALDAQGNIERELQEQSENDRDRYRISACELPREMINHEYFERYCRNRSCALVNQTCEDHADCCSQMCSNGRCLPNANNKVQIGDRCTSNQECETGICEKHPSAPYKICYGTNQTGLCSYNGESCFENSNCCSNSCYNKRCIGSREYPSYRGEFCFSNHNECASLQCDFNKNRCR